MKLLKSALFLITAFLAFITIMISLGSVMCKFILLPETSLIQACGYVAFFWIMALSVVIFLSFLLLMYFRTAFSFLALMIIFTFLLNDFSDNFIKNKIPKNIQTYDSLKIVAYNVRYYSYGIEKITQYIKDSDFDMVLLSESVLNSEKLEYLKSNLITYSVLTDNGHDLSLLSKYPVVSYKIIELPTFLASLSGSNDIGKLTSKGIHRSFIHAVVNFKGTHVNVLSVRFIAGRAKNKSLGENIKWGEYLIGAQNEELSVFLNYVHSLKGPVIFGGDLNVPPNTSIIHEINQFADDTYLDEHAFGSFTFRTSFPTMRIDYIFHSKDVIAKNSEIVRVRLSDHFPVRAEFLVPRGNAQALK